MIAAAKTRLSAGEKIKAARLYGITLSGGAGTVAAVETACRGGADVIQLRDKTLSARDMAALGGQLRAVCSRYEVLFIVNDRLDVALACGADGVHLGQDDLSLKDARAIARKAAPSSGADFLIGCSTHSLEQALKAESDGADYVGCGPVLATATKPGVPAVGYDLIRQYRENLRIPFVAIGGIDEGNVQKALESGAFCVAAVRAIFGAADVESAARSLKRKIESYK